MSTDPEVIEILNRLNLRALKVPRYTFNDVNFSLMVMLLIRERVTVNEIAQMMNANPNTVKKWSEAVNRPRRRVTADLLVAIADKYLMPERMAECGVITDEFKIQQMSRTV